MHVFTSAFVLALFLVLLGFVTAAPLILDPDVLQAAVDAVEYVYNLTTTDVLAIPGYILSNLGIFTFVVQNIKQVAAAWAGDFEGDAGAVETFITLWIAPWVPV
jgi:hypothetical protein